MALNDIIAGLYAGACKTIAIPVDAEAVRDYLNYRKDQPKKSLKKKIGKGVAGVGILAMLASPVSCKMPTGPDTDNGGYEQPTDPVEITSFTINNQSESNQAYHNSVDNFDFDVSGDWDTVSLRYRVDGGEWLDQDINSPLTVANGRYDFEVRAERDDEVDFSNITAYVHNLNTDITDALSHMADGSVDYSVTGHFDDVFGEDNWVLNVYREWADDINVPNSWTGAELKETVTDASGLDSLLLDQPGVYSFEVGRRDGSSNSIDGYAQRIATGLKGVNDNPYGIEEDGFYGTIDGNSGSFNIDPKKEGSFPDPNRHGIFFGTDDDLPIFVTSFDEETGEIVYQDAQEGVYKIEFYTEDEHGMKSTKRVYEISVIERPPP